MFNNLSLTIRRRTLLLNQKSPTILIKTEATFLVLKTSRLKRRSLHGDVSLAFAPDHDLYSENESEAAHTFTSPFSAKGSTVFRMGSFSKDPSFGNLPAEKKVHKRPPSWKRCSRSVKGGPSSDHTLQLISKQDDSNTKSKADTPALE